MIMLMHFARMQFENITCIMKFQYLVEGQRIDKKIIRCIETAENRGDYVRNVKLQIMFVFQKKKSEVQ